MQNGSALDFPFFERQRFSASDIHGQFVAVLDSGAIAWSTIRKYLKKLSCTADKEVIA
jgi:hypothetical protein